jgi:hypothetical protein
LQLIHRRVGPAIMSLHRIEALLTTVDAEKAAKFVEKFRMAATDLQSAVRHPSAHKGFPLPTSAEWETIYDKVGTARADFFRQIKLDFKAS